MPDDDVQRSKPIPIVTEHPRHRSTSFSSDQSNSPNNSPPPVTPKNFPCQIPISSSSPILSFLSQSPTKTSATFPFRGFAPPPVLEDEPTDNVKQATHTRRTSTTGRFQPLSQPAEAHHERGVNVLRRLSLSGPRPKVPTPDTPAPTVSKDMNHKPRRSATVTDHTRPRRAPSPMGERILKGHFDGFN